tara:strand:+ start:3609 stop:4232 length:624 start_codon:yes stop_codon:yes gene_type:complete
MISHKYKCIFIHIQRTAGGAIESQIDGKDWWSDKNLRPHKHLLASQAKKIYSEYWKDYFKFSIVRNPWARMVSMLQFASSLGLREHNGLLEISEYKKKYGFPATVEYDPRFHHKKDIPKGCEGSAYSNILDEELDFIGSYENLEKDAQFIFNTIGANKKLEFRKPQNTIYNSTNYQPHYSNETREDITTMYKNDILKHEYAFKNGAK